MNTTGSSCSSSRRANSQIRVTIYNNRGHSSQIRTRCAVKHRGNQCSLTTYRPHTTPSSGHARAFAHPVIYLNLTVVSVLSREKAKRAALNGGGPMRPRAAEDEVDGKLQALKNAAADLPHGGGKSVLYGDPAMPKADKMR